MKYNPFQIFDTPQRDEVQSWQKSREAQKDQKFGQNSSSRFSRKKEEPSQKTLSDPDDIFELQPIKRKHSANIEDAQETRSSRPSGQNRTSVPSFSRDRHDDLFEIRQELSRRQMISEPHTDQYNGSSLADDGDEHFPDRDSQRIRGGGHIIYDSNYKRISENYRRINEERNQYRFSPYHFGGISGFYSNTLFKTFFVFALIIFQAILVYLL